MGFDVGSAVNGASTRLTKLPVIGGCVKNPLFLALFLTALVLIVMWAVLAKSLKGVGMKRIARVAIIFFVVAATMLIIHQAVIRSTVEETAVVGGRREVFDGIEASRQLTHGAGVHPVLPGAFDDDEGWLADRRARRRARWEGRGGGGAADDGYGEADVWADEGYEGYEGYGGPGAYDERRGHESAEAGTGGRPDNLRPAPYPARDLREPVRPPALLGERRRAADGGDRHRHRHHRP